MFDFAKNRAEYKKRRHAFSEAEKLDHRVTQLRRYLDLIDERIAAAKAKKKGSKDLVEQREALVAEITQAEARRAEYPETVAPRTTRLPRRARRAAARQARILKGLS